MPMAKKIGDEEGSGTDIMRGCETRSFSVEPSEK
jgi:hypothetical protein